MHTLIVMLLCLATSQAQASLVSADTLVTSTVNAQPGASGIVFSSSAHLSVNNGMTLSGAAGAIILASSVTASSFWGDGSSLTNANNAVLQATQTFSGGNTFTSSFTIQSHGRLIVFSTSSTVNNMALNSDGTVSFYPELHNSSHTIIPAASTTNTSLGSCIAGSTLTITTTGGDVEVTFTGAMNTSPTTSAGLNLSVLQDGQFPPGLNSTTGIIRAVTLNALTTQACFSYLFKGVSAGTHFYCLTPATIGSGTADIPNDSNTANIFYVKEIK